MKEYYLYFDESGNLGKSGRYFIISGIITEDPKSLYNSMKKTMLYIRNTYKNLNFNKYELKAKNAPSYVKKLILKKIASNKSARIIYIVADKKYIEDKMFEDKNRLYNYLLKLLLDNYSFFFKNNKVHLLLDNKTVKVNSLNSFEDYINIHFNLERKINVDLSVQYLDSSSKNAYNIQAADYVANALYSYFEHDFEDYFNIFYRKRQVSMHFPFEAFFIDQISNQEVAATEEIKNYP